MACPVPRQAVVLMSLNAHAFHNALAVWFDERLHQSGRENRSTAMRELADQIIGQAHAQV